MPRPLTYTLHNTRRIAETAVIVSELVNNRHDLFATLYRYRTRHYPSIAGAVAVRTWLRTWIANAAIGFESAVGSVGLGDDRRAAIDQYLTERFGLEPLEPEPESNNPDTTAY